MLERYSIRQVSLGAMGAVGLVACGGMLALLITSDSLRREVQRQSAQLQQDEATASRIVSYVDRQLHAAQRYSTTRAAGELERFRHEGLAVYDQIRGYLFRDLGPDERRLVERIREQHEEIEVAAQRAFAGADALPVDRLPEMTALEGALAELVDLRAARHREMLQQQQVWWRWVYAGWGAIALLFLATLATAAAFLRRRLLEPLAALSRAARSVGEGDFYARVGVTGHDELAAVAHSFNRMAGRLSTARAEAAHAERRYHSLFDSVPIGLYRTTPDGRFLDANAALVRILGYDSREELLATNAADVYLDPDERHRWMAAVEAGDGAALEVDRPHRRRDGESIWIRDRAHAVHDQDGRLRYYEGALTDVTERVRAVEAMRNSEARFRSLVENTSEGVVIISAAGSIRYHSPAVDRILGRAPAALHGGDLLALVHADDRSDVLQAYRELVAKPGRTHAIEFRCRRADGDWRVLHAIGTNLAHDPAVGGYVINMIDMTSNRRLEEQLQQSLKMEAVGRLAGGIAHDFNNLLTAIKGYADLLATSVDSAAGGDVAEIRRAVDRAAGLTRQLLAFSRRQVVRRRPTRVDVVLAELEPMLKRVISEDTRIDAVITEECWVHADPGQLEQVIMNLVVNASDAGPRSAIRIAVDPIVVAAPAGDGPPPGDYVRLLVQDDGCGIAQDALPYIFEPFFTTKEVGKGTGLGLATVYGIVREGGGYVLVDSEPDTGTTVRVFLPRVARPAAPLAAEPPSPHLERSTRGLVLLVEDEEAVRSIAERVLRGRGYTVVSAAHGIEALELASTMDGEIELLLTDVVMPAMGGVQLARELLQRQPGLTVLFMSGYAADALPIRENGLPSHFLEKPFSPAQLTAAVQNALAPRAYAARPG